MRAGQRTGWECRRLRVEIADHPNIVYHRSLSIRVTPAFFAHAFSRHRTKAALAVLGNGAERDLPIVEGIED